VARSRPIALAGIAAALLANFWVLEDVLARRTDLSEAWISDLAARTEAGGWRFQLLEVAAGLAIAGFAWLLLRRQGGRSPMLRRGLLALAAAGLLAALVVIAAIVFGATYGLRHVWFLGTDDAGRVALYRGLPYELPFGVKLWSEKYAAPVQTESLPEKRKDAVTGQGLRSHEDAVKLLEEIERGQGVAR